VRPLKLNLGGVQVLTKRLFERRGYPCLDKGWPDLLVTLKDGRPVFVEVKGPGDELHGDQPQVLDILKKAGLLVVVARVGKSGFIRKLEGDEKVVSELTRMWTISEMFIMPDPEYAGYSL
jgi:hypothetical protein